MTADTLAPIAMTDNDGDALVASPMPDGSVALATNSPTDSVCVLLSRAQVVHLVHYLADHLDLTDAHETAEAYDLPNATRDGYDWPELDQPLAEWERELLDAVGHTEDQAGCDQCDTEPTRDTITAEAEQAVYGDRQHDYGHPREDFTRTAILWTGLLHHKLADGEHLAPEDVARCQIGVKLARDVHHPKRDNRVDMAGYALTLDRLETGQ